MKMTRKEFELYVKDTRKNTATYNRGRNVVILSEYSVKGQLVLEQGSRYEGTELYDVYSRPSDEKIEAFEDARYMYASDPTANSFSICSHNCQMFTCSWLNNDGLVFLTNKTEYLVLINE